jgi:hypothetical protein
VLDPKQTLQSLVIGASSNTLEVLNSLVCVPMQTNIKICKVAGPGIAVGTPFNFSVGSSTVTVPAGPAPGGTCVLGPSVPVGSTVTVSETTAGSTVTSIAVAPASRLVGTPNLAGGSVNVAIGSGMTDVTFTNQKLGFLEICKSGDVAGTFTFTVNPGGLGPFAVPAGACSPAIQVNAGQVVIQEAPTSGISMTGCATVPASQQGPCNLSAGTSTVTVASGDISSATVALITNRKDKETGTLTLKKTIAAPPGGSLPNLSGVVFPVDVVCTPGPSTTVTLTATNPSQVISNIPVGATCNIVEQPVTSTGTCGRPLVSVASPPTYLPGQNVTIPALPASASVEVTNVLACVAQGSLTVIKKMAPGPAAPPAIPPGVTFPVQVSCTPNGPNQIVNLTAATPNVTLSNINAGSTCTITELAPVGPIPSNCKWGPPTYPGGQSATITAQPTAERVVQNALICTGPVLAPVTLLKTITNLVPGMATPNTPFPAAITCQPGGAVVNVALLPNTPQTVNLPVGSSCNVAEVTPLPPQSGTCVPGAAVPPVWLPPVYLPGQPVTIPAPPAQLTVTVNNVMACSPTGSLMVTKKITSQIPGVVVPPLTAFVANVACTPFGPNTSVTLTPATPFQVIPNIQVGSTCNVTEQPPPQLPGTCIPGVPGSLVWLPPTFTPGQGVTIAAPPAMSDVVVGNTLSCGQVTQNACVVDPGMVAAGNTFARRVTLAQTFTPTQTGSLTQITHGLQGSVANYQLLVTTTAGGLPSWTGGSTSTANVLLAMSGLTIFSNSASVNGVVQIPAGQQPHLTAGTQYALILIPGSPTSADMQWRGNSSTGSYPNGSAYELNGTTWSVPGTGPKDHGFKLDGRCP